MSAKKVTAYQQRSSVNTANGSDPATATANGGTPSQRAAAMRQFEAKGVFVEPSDQTKAAVAGSGGGACWSSTKAKKPTEMLSVGDGGRQKEMGVSV